MENLPQSEQAEALMLREAEQAQRDAVEAFIWFQEQYSRIRNGTLRPTCAARTR